MPVHPKESYQNPVRQVLEAYFYEVFWKDILALLPSAKKLQNASSPVLDAIRSGKIQYKNGVITGTFNMKISKELSDMGMKFDGRRKLWTGIPSPAVISAATVINNQNRKLAEAINSKIGEIPYRVEMSVDGLVFPIDRALDDIDKDASADLFRVGIDIEMRPELRDRLNEEFNENMKLNIKNWSDDQVVRLREMIEQNALAGYNRAELERMITGEYGVTMNKARFLARNEVMLFTSSVARERYEDAGAEYYRWSTAKDSRVVGTPGGLFPDPSKGHGNHYLLQGAICKFSDPSVFASSLDDAKAGKWKSKSVIEATNRHPGQDYQCRCVAIPVVL